LRVEQRLARDDLDRAQQLLGPVGEQHDHVAETLHPCLLHERERGPGVGGDQRRGPRAERGGKRFLTAGFGIDEREREPLTALGQGTGRRGEPLALRERAVERLEPALCDPRRLGERVSGGRRLARRGQRRLRLALEPGRVERRRLLGGSQLCPHVGDQCLRPLGANA
jgi:hypothetical protein